MKPLFFDLDGTLIDSKVDIANSVNASLTHFHLKPLNNQTIYKFVGNGVKQLLMDCLQQDNKMKIFNEFYIYFLQYYHKHLLDNTTVYDGVFDMLNASKKKYQMFVVTNKSELFARKVIDGLELSCYFQDIVGGDTYPNKKPHSQPILELVKKYDLNIKNSLLVGDSENDILTAKAANLKIAWVSYGFRDKSILESNKVDYIINYPTQLLDILYCNTQ